MVADGWRSKHHWTNYSSIEFSNVKRLMEMEQGSIPNPWIIIWMKLWMKIQSAFVRRKRSTIGHRHCANCTLYLCVRIEIVFSADGIQWVSLSVHCICYFVFHAVVAKSNKAFFWLKLIENNKGKYCHREVTSSKRAQTLDLHSLSVAFQTEPSKRVYINAFTWHLRSVTVRKITFNNLIFSRKCL